MVRFLVFSFGSAIGAVIDLALGLMFLRLGFSAWTSLGFAMLVSATVVYVFHQRHTFGSLHSRDLRLRRLVMFLLSTVAIYVFRVLLFEWLQGLGYVDVVALGVALIASVAVNFTVSRVLIFSRLGGG